jgi:large repetitive protein
MISSWQWGFGDGLDTSYSVHAPSIQHTYDAAGTYQVSLVVTSTEGLGGITDTMYKQVLVLPRPIAGFSAMPTCLGGTSVFTDLSQDNGSALESWYWDFDSPDSLATSLERSPTYIYSMADTFGVKLRVSAANGCYDSIVLDAVVNPLPQVQMGWDMGCVTKPVHFQGLFEGLGAGITAWQWAFDDPYSLRDTSSLQSPVWTYDSLGTYYPTLEVIDANGCVSQLRDTLVVNPVPVSAFTFKENYDNVQGQLGFTNLSDSAVRYYWLFGDGDETDEVDPVHQYLVDQVVYDIVLVSYNSYGCPDSLKYSYEFLFKGLYVPNAFAPDNPAAQVHEFRPKGINLKDYEVVVFDSWGNLLWQSTGLDATGSPAQGWDGTFEGEPLPMDVYLWKIKASFIDGSVWDGKSIGEREGIESETMGTVTLIR